ncbi:MAG: host attachment protein [Thalassobaculum sp.]|uniref:host attachment protein n=1 Tax=Thalassobaculum sp. TaxID=2022740 RepID=UPI0032F03A35
MRTVTWILTADHQHARVYAFTGRGADLAPVDALAMDDHLPASHEAGSHRPDLGYAAKGGPGHGYEPRTTPHEKAALGFVDRVASALEAAAGRDDFQRLIVSAPPRALGELRQRMPEAVRGRVVGELDLDLTKEPADAVLRHVDRFLV